MEPASIFSAFSNSLDKLSKFQVIAIVLSSIFIIGLCDYSVNETYPLLVFYLVPIGIATWRLGKGAGFLACLISIFPSVLDLRREEFWLKNPGSAIWNGSLFLGLFVLVVVLLDSLKRVLQFKYEAMRLTEIDRERALFISQHDALTGLPNRNTFHSKLKGFIESARLHNESFHVLFIDIDHFKQINDSMGHYVGDLFLKSVARSLQSSINADIDLLARLSGDEFGIICKSETSSERFADILISSVSKPISMDGKSIHVSISIGVATYPDDGTDSARLMICADLAMYQAKQAGRATYRIYTEELAASAKRKLDIREELKIALKNKALELHYQPLFNKDFNSVCAVEALLRWNHSKIPYLTTTEIIAIAEESELICELSQWILRAACAQAKLWQLEDGLYFPIAVNISSQHFNEEDFSQLLKNILFEAALEPSYLQLEITERVVMENSENNRNTMEILRNFGIHISVDDFGTGYSSLSYLKNFNFGSLKIDQFFVKGLPHDMHDVAITNAIVSLARGLGVIVIAEGVENKQQLEFLSSLGCDQFQGYLFSEPLSSAQFTSRITSGDWMLASDSTNYKKNRHSTALLH
jgi:diguanylate cyclase (GGDEF)-like protein